jgi:hypothetical protein
MKEESDHCGVTISVQDVNLVLNIINTVSKRGAFQPEEFQIVGTLFEKLKISVSQQSEQSEQLEFGFTAKEQ